MTGRQKNCTYVGCSNCSGMLCPEHSLVIVHLIQKFHKSKNDYYFCSGLCHAIWTLKEIEINSSHFNSLDSSWFPVMKNLSRELSRSIPNNE